LREAPIKDLAGRRSFASSAMDGENVKNAGAILHQATATEPAPRSVLGTSAVLHVVLLLSLQSKDSE